MTHKARFIPFDISHISLMDLKGDGIDEVFTMPNGMDYLDECVKTGDALTMVYDGRIVACFGVCPLWEGVGQVWLIPSVYIYDNPIVFALSVRKMLDSTIESHKYHRVQAIISVNLSVGERWIEMLGFTKEGLLRKYTPQGTDYHIYARVT